MERAERMSNVIPVDNETHSSATRTTVDNRRITYKVKIVQQPLRARACGAGAKSSADRRPVDPPPIIQLNIFEGENAEVDITNIIAANYFLFTTLEQARPIAKGRVPEDKSRACTALAGTAAAGMVLLERPTPAGYFIFPDLSVRHEGKYRLSFSLYEEIKYPKDADRVDDPANASPSDHVTHRLEVKSEPFIVYSAKKFPGLTESTALSRMVADQGCRVRIRRDVRMRRRNDDKSSGKDWDAYEEQAAAARARMSATPEASHYGGYADPINRPRSASNGTIHSVANPLSRRTSLQDISQAYPQPYATPRTPQHEPLSASSYCPPTGHQFSQAPFVQHPAAPMQPPPTQQFQHPMSTVGHSNYTYYATSTAPQSPIVPSPPVFDAFAQGQRFGVDYSASQNDVRRPSLQSAQPLPVQDPFYQPPGPHTPQASMQPMFPRSQATQPPSRIAASHTVGSAPQQLPPLTMNMPGETKFIPASPISGPTQHSFFPPDTSHKRSFGRVFDDQHISQPLRDGARPSLPYGSTSSIANPTDFAATDDTDADQSDDYDPRSMAMRYKRADGSSVIRAVPPHVIP